MTKPFHNVVFDKPVNRTTKSLAYDLVLLFIWLFLWFAPWSYWLDTNLWIKTGIALIILIVPGAYLSLLLSRENTPNISSFTSGFVFSQVLLALMGLAGRFLHVAFAFIENAFMALGLILIAVHAFKNNNEKKATLNFRSFLTTSISYWPLLVIAGLAALMTIQRVITSDDLAYLAHITNWQHMPVLNFSDVYFNIDKIDSTRFWIVSAPFSQAFLAKISRIPGLVLLSGYYDPFLAVISVFCFYELARVLGLSRNYAMISVTFQLACMALLSDYLHPGAPFFHQLSTDKATAAFILAPVFISQALKVLTEQKHGTVIQLLISGTSLTFMHPIVSAFAAFIVGIVSFLGIKRENFKKNVIVILLAGLTLLPQVAVRLIKHEAQPEIPNDISSIEETNGVETMIARIDGTPFYGFNPDILEMRLPYQEYLPILENFATWIWVAVPILAAFVSLIGIRNNYLNQYILATTLLVAFAGIPYTGWILGYFVSAWMLERTAWLYPFGICMVFLVQAFHAKTAIGKKLSSRKASIHKNLQVGFPEIEFVSIWIASLIVLFLVMREQNLPDISRLEGSTRRHQQLSAIGQYIDQNNQAPIDMIGSDELNDFIPAISWKAKVISYRPEDASYPYFYSQEERLQRWSDRKTIFTREETPDKRIELLQKYNIQYILLENNRLNLIRDLISAFPQNFEINTFGRYVLVKTKAINSIVDP